MKPVESPGLFHRKIASSEEQQGAPYWNAVRVALLGAVAMPRQTTQTLARLCAPETFRSSDLPVRKSGSSRGVP
jgi:hypothetical protein